MEYTKIDREAINTSVIEGKANEADLDIVNAKITAAKIAYSQNMRALEGLEPDPDLDSLAAEAVEAETKATATLARMESKLDPKKTDERAMARRMARRRDLSGWLTQVETEHAQHTELAVLCREVDDDAQADGHVLASLANEAAHAAGLAELAELNKVLPPDTDAEPVTKLPRK